VKRRLLNEGQNCGVCAEAAQREVLKLVSEFGVNLWSQRTSRRSNHIGTHSTPHTRRNTIEWRLLHYGAIAC